MNPNKDTAQEAIDLYQKEQAWFENHWVWKELNTKPEEFFKTVKEKVKALNLPKEKWDEIYGKAKATYETRAREKLSQYKQTNLRLIGSIRA